VYEHIRTDTGEVFYVGKGMGYRAWDKIGRNRYHKRIQEKLRRTGYHFDVHIIFDDLTENFAHRFEIERIRWWKSMGLCRPNIALGGQGSTGMKHTEETKAILRERSSGRVASPETRAAISRSNRGKNTAPKSEAHKEKLSNALKGRPVGPPSETHRRRISEALTGHPSYKATRTGKFGKRIVCLTDGREWPNARTAAAHYGIGHRLISLVLTGHRKRTGGMEFKFLSKMEE
jgi:hypothetical protein